MLKDSLSSARVFMGLSLLLLALVLFGASQGALKISFDALLMRNTAISGSIFVYHGFCWRCW